MTRSRLTLTLLSSTLISALATAGSAPPWQALSGSWTLNKTLSDSPRPGGPEGGPPPGMPPGGGPPPGGGEGKGMGPGGPGRHGPGGPADAIRIEVSGDTVTVTPQGGEARSLTVGGTPVERTRGPMTVTETVTWKDGAVVITGTVPDRPAMTESYALATDGSGRLVSTVTLPPRGSGESRTLRFVYDPVK